MGDSSSTNALSNAIGFAKFFSRSHDAVIRVYDEAVSVIEMREHNGDFKELIQPLAAVLTRFEFMQHFFMFATHASASGGSVPFR